MTVKEKDERLDRMEHHQRILKEKVEDIDKKVSKICDAVVGDKSMGSVGIAERMIDIEKEQESIKADIKKIEESRIEDKVYLKIIRWLGAIITGMVLAFIIKEYILVK
jgi:hypothetical protein